MIKSEIFCFRNIYLLQFTMIQIQVKETIIFSKSDNTYFFLVFMTLSWFFLQQKPRNSTISFTLYVIIWGTMRFFEIKMAGCFFIFTKNIYQSNLKSVLLSVAKVFLIWEWNIVVSTCLFLLIRYRFFSCRLKSY